MTARDLELRHGGRSSTASTVGSGRARMRTSLVLLCLLAACSVEQPPKAGTKPDAASNVPYKKLDLTDEKPVVGAEVRVAAADLPAACSQTWRNCVVLVMPQGLALLAALTWYWLNSPQPAAPVRGMVASAPSHVVAKEITVAPVPSYRDRWKTGRTKRR